MVLQTIGTYLVHEVFVADLLHTLIQEGALLVCRQPFLAIVNFLLAESHLNSRTIFIICPAVRQIDAAVSLCNEQGTFGCRCLKTKV